MASQNQLVVWTNLNKLPSKSQTQLNQIAVRMVSIRREDDLNYHSKFFPPHPTPFTFLGESAAPERPVSPDKLYRAALLKKRFADTILKAREKTLNQVSYQTGCLCTCLICADLFCQYLLLWIWSYAIWSCWDQGEKGDPERLRREKEELEFQKRKGRNLNYFYILFDY